MIVHHARWILPIVAPPIRDGWVAVDRGLIVALGGANDEAPPAPDAPLALRGPSASDDASASGATGVILPGLVNAHTHLELSWMRGRVPPAASMCDWVDRLLALRGTTSVDAPEPIVEAIHEARASGTALVGEITNTLAAYDALADSDLSAMIFRELIGFNAADPEGLVAAAEAELAELTPIEWLRTSVVPHAPYSGSPALLRAIGAAGDRPVSVHLGESKEEIEFLRDGSGRWRELLERLGAWDPSWRPPACGPVTYLDSLGLVNERLLAVHGVQLTDEELEHLAAAGATLVACPRSNRWTGVGTPPIERFYRAGVRVAFGTDSLASVEDLNLFSELALARRVAPGIPARQLLRSATIEGATALGFEGELGSIEPGKRAELVAVQVPDEVEDVEEYLVSDSHAGRVGWLDRE